MKERREYRPHPKLAAKYFVWVALVFFLGFFPYVFLGLIPEAGWTFVGLYLGANAVWILIACLLIPPYCRSISYELTADQVVARRGIVTKSEDMVPFRMITNVVLKRGPLDRLFGLGTLLVHTAGFSQQSAAECKLVGLAEYDQVRQLIMTQVLSQHTGAPVEQPVQPLGSDEVPEILQGILDEVRGLRSERKE